MTGVQDILKSPFEPLLAGASEPVPGAWRYEPVDPCVDAEWDRIASTHPEHTVFHTAAWARVLARTYGHRTMYLRAERGDQLGMLLPLMEVRSWWTGRRGVSLPFSDQCGPLVYGRFDAAPLIETLSQLARSRGWKHFEVRGGPALQNVTGRKPDYYSHALDLRQTEPGIFAGFDGSARRAVRKAERSGVKVRFDHDLAGMERYYGLHVQTRRKHGLPPQPFSFFKNIHRELVGRGQGFVALAEKEGRPVAAALFFQAGKHAVYKFGASDETRQEFRGSNLVMWDSIRFLQGRGAGTLDLGRTSIANEGLRRFKLSLGATERPQHYFRRATRSGTWLAAADKTTGGHQAVFRRLPLWINRLLGSIIYSHLD